MALLRFGALEYLFSMQDYTSTLYLLGIEPTWSYYIMISARGWALCLSGVYVCVEAATLPFVYSAYMGTLATWPRGLRDTMVIL